MLVNFPNKYVDFKIKRTMSIPQGTLRYPRGMCRVDVMECCREPCIRPDVISATLYLRVPTCTLMYLLKLQIEVIRVITVILI